MFKLLRYYSVTSFVAILAAAIMLTSFYRQVTIDGVFHLAERANRNLAQLAMNAIRPDLIEFLQATADRRAGEAVPPLPATLAQSIAELMHEDRFVAKIKVYNLHGIVVFSTSHEQIGGDQSSNQGVIGAAKGKVMSELVYRDTFNNFDGGTEEDNLFQTYLPIRASPLAPVSGVFELYGDVNQLIHQAERMQFIVIAGAIPILAALYGALILIVRHANRTIEQQQQTIRERNETLALMSAHMLRSQESQKKQVAFDLHEGVAQTLAALKLKAENRLMREKASTRDEPVDSIIPMLQDAIQEVRTIATDLHPPGLDDLGLLPTLDSLVRDFQQRHSGVAVEQRNSVQESNIPASLRGILYRIIESVLIDIAQQADQARVLLALERHGGNLVLLIEATLAVDVEVNQRSATTGSPRMDSEPFKQMEEMVTLSGGAFTSSQREGATILRGQWSD